MSICLPPDPPIVAAVIMREPCGECHESAFGYVTAGHMGGHAVTAATEYHKPDCPVTASGIAVIITAPITDVPFAGELTERIFREGK